MPATLNTEDKSTCCCATPCAQSGVVERASVSMHAATSRKNMHEELLFVIILLPSTNMFVRTSWVSIPVQAAARLENDLARDPQIPREILLELVSWSGPDGSEARPVPFVRGGVIHQSRRPGGNRGVWPGKQHRIQRVEGFATKREAHPFGHLEALLQ